MEFLVLSVDFGGFFGFVGGFFWHGWPPIGAIGACRWISVDFLVLSVDFGGFFGFVGGFFGNMMAVAVGACRCSSVDFGGFLGFVGAFLMCR